MKLGVCTNPDNVEKAAQAGFDYVEFSLSYIAGMEEDAFQALADKAPSFPIPALKCNGFFPGNVKLTGPDVCKKQVEEYLEKALSRAKKLGIKVLVLGSGAARQVPEGWDFAKAWQQFMEILQLVGQYAEKYDMDVALEPLRRKECNILNLVSEGLLVSAAVDHPRINVLGDTFHMHCCREPLSSLTNAGSRLRHVHVSCPKADESGRVFPARNDGQDYAALINTLKEMNYQGDVSVEAACNDFLEDGKEVVACMKHLF